MDALLRVVGESLVVQGLRIMPRKCHTLVLAPSGKDKKIKVVTDYPFRMRMEELRQLGPRINERILSLV